MAGETYTKRYGAGFVDKPTLTTPIDAQFLNAVEAALLRLLGEDPAQDEVGVWVPGSNRFVYQKITNAQVDAAAAIDKTKLNLTGTIVDADVSATAAIAQSKISGLVSALASAVTPSGVIIPNLGIATPTGWLLCDGSSQLRSSYASLFGALTAAKGAFTVTIASPGVFTNTAHGLVVGDAVYLTTSGALPTGLAQNTTYYVSNVPSADTFRLSATRGGADINTTGSQSGTHQLVHAPAGVADSTHFNVPDLMGRAFFGRASSGHADMKARGQNDGVALANRRVAHKHSVANTSHTHDQSKPYLYPYDGSEGAWIAVNGGGATNIAFHAASPGVGVPSTAPTVGPQTGAEPTDAVPYYVGDWIVKT